MKSTEQYFPVVLFIMRYTVVLRLESADEILWCEHSNATSFTVLSLGTICFSAFYKMKCRNLLNFDVGIERIRWYSRFFFLCFHTQKIFSFDVAQKRQSSTYIYHYTFTPRDDYADTEGILKLSSVWSNSVSVNIQLRPHLELFPSAICFFSQNLEISREYRVICNGYSISHLAYKVFWSNPVPEMVA